MHHKFVSQLVELKIVSQLNQMHWSDKWDLNQNRSKDAAVTVIYYASDASVSKFHYTAIALNIWQKGNQPNVFACKMHSFRLKPQTNFLIKFLKVAKCECKLSWKTIWMPKWSGITNTNTNTNLNIFNRSCRQLFELEKNSI